MSTTKKAKTVKRSGSPATSSSGSKKKRPATPQLSLELEGGDSNASSPAVEIQETKPQLQALFKDPTFVHSTKGAAGNKKTRVWKNVKQIIASEKILPWKPDDVTYGSIEAPPSFKPAKKYSDLTGLEAKYRDPHSKIRYATPDEFNRIKLLPSDIIGGHLALRKANTMVG